MKTLHTLSTLSLLTFSILSYSNEVNSNYSNLTIQFKNIQMPTCNGMANGSATAEVSGGKMPYQYSWNTYPEQHTEQATNLKAGIYFLQIIDANGQVFFSSVEIADPIQTSSTGEAVTSTDFEVLIAENENTYSIFVDGVMVSSDVVHDLDVGIHKLVITNNQNCTVMQFVQVMEQENKMENPELVIVSTPLSSVENLEEENFNVNLTLNE